MAIKVSQETVAGITSNRFVLSSSGIMRQMAMGSNWQKMRVAMVVNTTGTSEILNSPGIYFGICQGTTNGVLSENTDAFIGVQSSGTSFTTSPLHRSSSWRSVTKSGATLTVYNNYAFAIELVSLESVDDYANALILDIEKISSTILKLSLWGQLTTAAAIHITGSILQTMCNDGSNPNNSIGGGASVYSFLNFPNITVPDVSVYDSIQVATDFPEEFQIESIAFGRLA